MDAEKARKLLAIIADGVDPFTGECFEPDSPYQNPEMIRALFAGVRSLDAEILAQKQSGQATRETTADAARPGRVGEPWLAEEDAELRREFERRIPVKEIAAGHGRSEGAIASRLLRLGLLQVRDDVRGLPDA